jgi:hypothetical protein
MSPYIICWPTLFVVHVGTRTMTAQKKVSLLHVSGVPNINLAMPEAMWVGSYGILDIDLQPLHIT